MKKLHYFTNIDPVNYDYSAQDTMKHLYFKDYKHLAGVQWLDTEPSDNKLTSDDYLSIIGLIIGFITIIAVLFLG